jgi:hypothetical protein
MRTMTADELRAALDTWERMPPTLVVIAPIGRSGSILMQSLLDGHPAVVGFPVWFTTSHAENTSAKAMTLDEARAYALEFVAKNITVFDGRTSFFGDTHLLSRGGQLGANAGEVHQIPQGPFADALAEMLAGAPFDTRRFFLAIHLALVALEGRVPSAVTTIAFHNHNQLLDTSAALLRDFPEARYLFMARDPRESILSFQKLEEELAGHGHVFTQVLMHLRINADQALRAHRVAEQTRTALVRYADLNRMHAAREGGMRALAAWIGIRWHPTLLQSTVLGLTWHGNATDRRPNTGFDASRARLRWPEQLDPDVARMIEHLFYEYMLFMRYEVASRPTRASIRWTLFTHDPIPTLFPVASLQDSPGRIVDRALNDDPSTFRGPWSKRVPLPLARGERVARNLYRFYRDENRRRWELFRLRFSSRGLAVFDELEAALRATPGDESQLVALLPPLQG